MGRHGSVDRNWIVELIDERFVHLRGSNELLWVSMPEETYRPSAKFQCNPYQPMKPRTFHGVVRQMKALLEFAESDIFYGYESIREARLRNIVTNEIIPWAAMGV